MSFGWPLALLSLALLPLVAAAYVWAQRRPPRYAVAFTNLDVLASVVDGRSAWRRHVPAALLLLALAALCVGLARPAVATTVPREDATVVLAIDSSGSMFAEDVEPTRLAAAQRAVRRFLERIPEQFRVGMVTFGGDATIVAPASTDRELVRSALEFLVPLRGTAIGDALDRSVQLGRDSLGGAAALAAAREGDEAPPVAILMLSDGSQTVGNLLPLEGAQLAKQHGIPVYTIALGTPDGVIEFGFGRIIPVPPDPETLRLIAQTTGGEFFDAPSAEALVAAYDALGSKLSRQPGELEVTFAFLAGGALLALGATLLSRLWGARLP